ncbi:MAG: acetolactate synthase [Candidatus Omnitrophica bacterium]|nr:acetolactate synthase [Candidatus Omnitrophota bacterium]
MEDKTLQGRQADRVRQFSVFTPNRLGRLHDLINMLGAQEIHVLALMVLDTTDSSIIRLVVDDPEQAHSLLLKHGFPFTESELSVVEVDGVSGLRSLLTSLLEAEININYLYSLIVHPRGKPLLALNIEDNEIAEQTLRRHQFRVLMQADLSR